MMTDAELDLLIIQAKEAAGRAWDIEGAAVGASGPAGFIWIEVPIDGAHYDLAARLGRASIGRMVEGLKGQPPFHRVLIDHFIHEPLSWSINLQIAACKAFVRTLTEAGFSPSVKRLVA